MFLKNYWYVAAWDHELKNAPLGRTFLGEPVVMYRAKDGTPVAFEDRCCHRRAPLSLGRVVGDDLQCGYHGLVYDRTGQCIAVPGQTALPPGARLRAYPVVERWNWVWIWMGDPAAADPALIPNIWWHDHPDWAVVGGYLNFRCQYQLLVDNLLDLTHETFLHAKTIGNEHVARTPLAKVTRDTADDIAHSVLKGCATGGRSVTATRWMLDIAPPPFYAKACGFDKPGDRVDRWQFIRFEPPSHVWLDVGVAVPGSGAPQGDRRQGFSHVVVDSITPETERSTHYFWTFPRNYKVGDRALSDFLQKGVHNTFLEDQAMLEGQQRVIEADPAAPEIDINADGASVQARRIVAQLLEAEVKARGATRQRRSA
jgi:vanillate O-demethylase monooxygenase subunit